MVFLAGDPLPFCSPQMKSPGRFLAAIVAILAGMIVAAVIVVAVRSDAVLHRIHAVPPAELTVTSDAAAIARGHHVALVRGCVACHGPDLGGAEVMDNFPMGRIYGPNLTRGRGGLPEGFTDEDFERAIRHGVAPDGRGLFLMPSDDYSDLSRSDLNDLIAYVKSVPPVNRASVPIRLGPVARVLLAAGKMTLAADRIDHASVQPDEVPPGATVAYGRYLSTACSGCHGEHFSGGKIAGGAPDWPPAANLTPDPSGGLGKWTEADFEHLLKTGLRPDGSSVSPVMPRVFGQMDPTEMQALWLFLRSLPPRPTGSH